MAHGLAAGKKQLDAYKAAGFTGNTTASSTKVANRPEVIARVQEIIATQHKKEIRSNERAIEKASQFMLQAILINRRRPAARQVVDLTINAGPVAGVVGIEVDAHRNATGTAGNHGIHVAQSGTVTPVVFDRQHGSIV